MFQAYGLYTHIQANRMRSAVLLLGFVALLQALLYSFLIIFHALTGGGSVGDILGRAAAGFSGVWPFAMIAALVWFALAWLMHQGLIAMATGARSVERRAEPKLYNALENLCISRGIPMPALDIIETPALNAYAAGLREGQYRVAVTRGLVDTLSDDELEAVLAHELTHIRNRDAQLMVIAVVFAGIFAFFGDLVIGRWDFPYGWSPRGKRQDRTSSDDWGTMEGGRGGSRDRDGKGGGGVAIAILIAIAIVLITWGISTLIRFALSRSREFLADAGAVELTKNPDAMIRALRKIEANATFDVPSRMEAFFIENPLKSRVAGLLSTHPPMSERIGALQQHAGGRDAGPLAARGAGPAA